MGPLKELSDLSLAQKMGNLTNLSQDNYLEIFNREQSTIYNIEERNYMHHLTDVRNIKINPKTSNHSTRYNTKLKQNQSESDIKVNQGLSHAEEYETLFPTCHNNGLVISTLAQRKKPLNHAHKTHGDIP